MGFLVGHRSTAGASPLAAEVSSGRNRMVAVDGSLATDPVPVVVLLWMVSVDDSVVPKDAPVVSLWFVLT